MSLLAALNAAKSSLSSTAAQTAIASRNIANAGDPSYARKSAVLVVGVDGAGQVASINRAADLALRRAAIESSSAAAAQQILSDGFDRLEPVVGQGGSIAIDIGALSDALQQYATSPDNDAAGQTVLAKASSLAASLRSASAAVQSVRTDADARIADSVDTINDLLAQFREVDHQVTNGGPGSAETGAAADRRDAILSSLAIEIGIKVVQKSDGSTAIYTDSGAVLYDKEPRSVTFQKTQPLSPTSAGRAVYVDGVDITSLSSVMKLSSGRIAGAANLRDAVAPQAQAQLDEIARGLIAAFAEHDTSVPATLPDIPGLFTYAGAPAMPGGLLPGLAAGIRVSPNADPAQGGVISRLRDGGIGDPGNPAYASNPTGAAGYSGRILALLDGLNATSAFDPAAGLEAQASVSDYAISSSAWFETRRQDTSATLERNTALRDHAQSTLRDTTGVNLDDEMARILELEHSYQASAKLLSIIDLLLQSLIGSVR